MSTNQTITNFANLPASEQSKFYAFHAVRYDLSIIDTAAKSFMSHPNPSLMTSLSTKLSAFIQTEIIPLINHESDNETENN